MCLTDEVKNVAMAILDEIEPRQVDVGVDEKTLNKAIKAQQGTVETKDQVGGYCCYAG